MAGLQSRINQLTKAFKCKYNKNIKIDSIQIYSKEYQKMFTKYEVNEISEEKTKIKNKLKEQRKKYKEIKNKCNNADKLEKEIYELDTYLHTRYIFKTEFFKKVEVLLFLVNWYKRIEAIQNE